MWTPDVREAAGALAMARRGHPIVAAVRVRNELAFGLPDRDPDPESFMTHGVDRSEASATTDPAE